MPAGFDEGYDEFGMLAENAAEAGLPWPPDPPAVRRQFIEMADGRWISAIRWGRDTPEIVLLHGGGQNAHTWDTVALALGRPSVAIDLPGHGRSDWRADHDYAPTTMAGDLVQAIDAWAPEAAAVVGMSLGGLAGVALAQAQPGLVRRLALVDILPGADAHQIESIVAFLSGPDRFESFEAIIDRAVAFSPNRPVTALRRGARHNAHQLPDGSWTWRWDPVRRWHPGDQPGGAPDFHALWAAVDALRVPLLVLKGARSAMVADRDIADLLARQQTAEAAVIEGSGHNVQGDRPLELARRLAAFLPSRP